MESLQASAVEVATERVRLEAQVEELSQQAEHAAQEAEGTEKSLRDALEASRRDAEAVAEERRAYCTEMEVWYSLYSIVCCILYNRRLFCCRAVVMTVFLIDLEVNRAVLRKRWCVSLSSSNLRI